MSYRPNMLSVTLAKPAAVPLPQSAQDMVLTQLVAEHRCLSEALYYEARGEGRVAEKAIAEVVFHRMNAGRYGHSICAVVYEGSSHPDCQFSFTCMARFTVRVKRPLGWSPSSSRLKFSPAKCRCATPPAARPTIIPFGCVPSGLRH
jgi:spore germination cell wall hydrolase CwlJ-like protein